MVLFIISFLMSMAVPVFSQALERMQLRQVTTQLRQALLLTQQFAIAHKKRILLCGSTDGQHCDGHWKQYWLILRSQDHQLLYWFQPHSSVSIVWRGNQHQREGIIMWPDGSTAGQQGRFELSLHQQKRMLVLIRTGRVRET